MELTSIIAISGKPGLFKVIAQGKNSIIVESLIDKKRTPAFATDRISALDDISIYTYDEDAPLKDILKAIFDKEGGKETLSHKEDIKKLTAYLVEILPNYDQERVYPSDIKKIFQWYNLLLSAGLLKSEEKVEAKKEKAPKAAKETEGDKKEEKTPKKTAAKTATKTPAKPKATVADKSKAAKPVAAKKATTTKQSTSRGK